MEVWIAINKITKQALSYVTSEGYTTYIFNDSRNLCKYMREHKMVREDFVIIAGEIIP